MDPPCSFHPSRLVRHDCGLSVRSLINSFETTREYYRFQLTAFLVNSMIVFGAKALNSLGQYLSIYYVICRQYWIYFATKNYFDDNGFFISFFISIPMLIITAIQIVYGKKGDFTS